MSFSNFVGNAHFENDVSFGGGMTLPSGVVDDSQVKSTNPISAEKVEHQFEFKLSQKEGAALIAESEMVHICRGIGQVMDIDASFGSVVATGDEVITIKVVKFTGATSDDVMSADIVLNSGNAVRIPEGQAGLDGTGKITATNDILEIQVTRAGTATAARGLIVNLVYKETPVD